MCCEPECLIQELMIAAVALMSAAISNQTV